MTGPAIIAAGSYPGIAHETYLRWPLCSSSRLRTLQRSPAHMRAEIDTPRKQTDAMLLGSAVHAAILEPDTFASRYVTAQRCTAVKKDKEQCANNGILCDPQLGWLCGVHCKGLPVANDPSLTVIAPEQMTTALAVRDSVLRHPRAKSLLSGDGENELSLCWVDAETGVRCKARYDRLHRGLTTIVDVKTTDDAGRESFSKSIYSWGYHIQNAFYLDGARQSGLDAETFAFVAVEKSAPFAVGVYVIEPEAQDYAYRQMRALLRRYAECVETGVYPAYGDDIEYIGLPKWAYSNIELQLAS